MQISHSPRPTKEWTHKLKRWTNSEPVSTKSGDTFVTSMQRSLVKLDTATGQEVWHADVGTVLSASPVVASDETVVVVSRDRPESSVIGLDRESGAVKWKLPQQGRIRFGDRLLFTGDETSFTARNVDTGDVRWTMPLAERTDVFSTGPANDLYCHTDNRESNNLSRVEDQTGKVLWSKELTSEADVSFTPLGRPLIEHYDFRDEGNEIEVLNPITGQVAWFKEFQEERYQTYTSPDDRILTVAFDDSSEPTRVLVSHDALTGREQWKTELPPIGDITFAEDGTNLVSTARTRQNRSQSLISVDAKSGDKMWTFEPDVDRFTATYAEGDTVYLVGRKDIPESDRRYESIIFALDKESGEKKWEKNVGQRPGEPKVHPSGKILFPIGLNRLICLDAETGAGEWYHQVDSQLEIAPDFTSDGRILTCDMEGQVAALSLDSQTAMPGDPPPNSDRDHGMPVATRGWSQKPLGEGTATILGQRTKVIGHDYTGDGDFDQRKTMLVADRNGDGEITDFDLGDMPTLATLTALDQNGDGFVFGEELEDLSLRAWFDRDHDGHISEGDYIDRPHGQHSYDLREMIDLERFT